MPPLSPLERRVLLSYRVPAAEISVAERLPVSTIMRIKANLRRRGFVARAPELEAPRTRTARSRHPGPEQLTLDLAG